jgi:nuclease-like protein
MGMKSGYSNAPGASAMKRSRELMREADCYSRGAWAECQTGTQLGYFERNGWTVRHDLASKRGNIDHAVAGPAGVFMLETKSWAGQITVDSDHKVSSTGYETGERGASVWSDAVSRAIELRTMIEETTGYDRFVPAIVVWWSDFPAELIDDGPVTWVHGDRLRKCLLAKQARLDSRTLECVGDALRRLPSAIDVGCGPLGDGGSRLDSVL